MRKIALFSLGFLLLVFNISCKKNSEKESALPFVDESSVLVENSSAVSEEKENDILPEKKINKDNKVDFDWTKMNYNMLSSLIFDVQVNPENYEGKRVKVSGNFHTSVYEGRRYFSVIRWDPTGCCPTGMDFIPPESMKYPENFPELDTYINVTGIIHSTTIDGMDYIAFTAEEINF